MAIDHHLQAMLMAIHLKVVEVLDSIKRCHQQSMVNRVPTVEDSPLALHLLLDTEEGNLQAHLQPQVTEDGNHQVHHLTQAMATAQESKYREAVKDTSDMIHLLHYLYINKMACQFQLAKLLRWMQQRAVQISATISSLSGR